MAHRRETGIAKRANGDDWALLAPPAVLGLPYRGKDLQWSIHPAASGVSADHVEGRPVIVVRQA
jgi:hypothetical protein